MINDISKKPYAGFFEETLAQICAMDISSIGIIARAADGTYFTGYYGCGLEEKALLAHYIDSDIIMDIVTANAGAILASAEEEDGEEEQEEDEDESEDNQRAEREHDGESAGKET